MSTEVKRRAQGYRVPKIDIKSMVLSILTFGFKKQKQTKEEAKTYEYLFEDAGIRISEIERDGNKKMIAYTSAYTADEREKILSKGKFEEGAYVYYLDRETIS